MAASISSLVKDNVGNLRMHTGTLNLATHATGGVAVTPELFGLHTIRRLLVMPTSGYVAGYVASTGKVIAYRGPGATPAGTLTQPTFTVKTGTIGANMTIGLTADAATASLVGGTGITADRSLTTNNPVGTPTFTGTAISAAVLADVGAVDLSAVNFEFEVFGY